MCRSDRLCRVTVVGREPPARSREDRGMEECKGNESTGHTLTRAALQAAHPPLRRPNRGITLNLTSHYRVGLD